MSTSQNETETTEGLADELNSMVYATGSESEIYSHVSKTLESPYLTEKRTEGSPKDKVEKTEKVEPKKGFSLSSFSSKKKDVDVNEITEDSVNSEMNSTTEEETKEFAEFVLKGVDWSAGKVAGFFGKEFKESAITDKKLDRLITIFTRICIKRGWLFQDEHLFFLLLVGYGASKFADLQDKEEKDVKKPPKNKSDNSHLNVVKPSKPEPKVKREKNGNPEPVKKHIPISMMNSNGG